MIKSIRKIVPRNTFVVAVIFVFWISGARNSESAIFEFGWEPFLVKQFNPELVKEYQSGALVSFAIQQGEYDLWLHMASLRWQYSWNLPINNSSVGIETGLSLTPFPIRKTWVISALDANFTGTVMEPSNTSIVDQWNGHSIDYTLNGLERYLIEESRFSYIPLLLKIQKIFPIGESFGIETGLSAGVSLFYASIERKKLSGNPPARFAQSERSMVHMLQTGGIDLALSYSINQKTQVFFGIQANGVDNISNLQRSQSVLDGTAEGYRFDGLRYNAKLGVSWKI